MESFDDTTLDSTLASINDINAVCRCCLASEQVIEIFNEHMELTSEVEEVLRPAYIIVDPDDGLPNLICNSCLTLLRNWHQFRLKCDDSYKLLERLHEYPTEVLVDDVKIEEICVGNEAFLESVQEHVQNSVCITSIKEEPVTSCDSKNIESIPQHEQEIDHHSSVLEKQKKRFRKDVMGCQKKRYVYLRQCPICGIVLKRGLKEHIMAHNDPSGRPFKCENCDKTYCRKENLRQHREREHMMIRYPCDICGNIFSTKGVLSAHRKLHNSEVQFKCDQCDQVFKSSKYLYKHKQKHLGIKKFVCSYCGKSFLVGEYLKDHLRIHTGEKPFDCKTCGKTFRTMNHLRQHMRTHASSDQNCIDKSTSCKTDS